MKKWTLVFGLLFLTLFATNCASTGGSIDLPDHKAYRLKNELEVLYVEDRTLPYISLGLLVRVGGRQDPLGKSGLAELTAELLERGTKNKTAEQLSDAFGKLGTSFSTSVDYDFTYLSVAGLSRTQKELIQLFHEVVTEPSFSNEEVERLKREYVASLKRSYDQPGWVANRAFAQYLYGTHPYARDVDGSVRDLQSIKQKDVIRQYLKSFRPNQSILVIVGDIDKESRRLLEDKFATWQNRGMEPAVVPDLPVTSGVQVRLVDRGDLKQSEVRMGHVGVSRKNDDYLALTMADTILSGGFNSRLMREIRVKRGLTYGISGNFYARELPGPFLISSNTRHEKVGELVLETQKQLQEFYEKGVTEQEIEEARGYLRGLFPRRIETPEQLAMMIVTLQFYGIDESYMTNYVKNVNKLSVKDINRVIKKYYKPQDLKIVVYGPKSAVIEQLRPVGAVEVKNYQGLF
jgi:zinc protease